MLETLGLILFSFFLFLFFNFTIVYCFWNAVKDYILWHKDFPGGSDSKASVSNVRDLGLIPGLGRFPGEVNGNPLQYSCLENPMEEELGAGYYPWGCKESGTTERLHVHFLSFCDTKTLTWPWKVVAESYKDAEILGLQRRRIQSGARDEVWSLRVFV